MADPQKLVIRGGVKVEFARITAGTIGAYVRITPRGSVSVNSQFGTQTYADFSSAMGVIAAQVPDGDRTVTVTFNTWLIPSDTAYNSAYEAHRNAEEIALRVTFGDRAGTDDAVRHYRGFLPSWNEQANQDGAAETSVTFNASGEITTPATP